MITISLCMIVKNEESVLSRCLESIKSAVDEIIIVDTGSTDKTKEIAREFTDKVFDFKWVDDFSKARNFSFSKANMEYQMWLDADDIVEEHELEKILELKKTLNPDIDIVMMKYNTHFDFEGKPILTTTRERLFKKEKNFFWNDPIHEYVLMIGNVYRSDITISHKKEGISGDRNIRIYEQLLEQGQKLSPRSTYYYARELMDWRKYPEAVEYFNKFLVSKLGWYEDCISACFNLGRCYSFLNQKDKILPILLKSFEFDTPRAEICCQIGYFYKERKEYEKAIFWFELALTLKKKSQGFILNDYWDFIPSIELCLCYSVMGDLNKAYNYHKFSAEYKPNNKSVVHNEEYFKKLGFFE